MDIFDTLYLGTPADQALDTPLPPDQKKSMIDAAAQKLSELLEILGIDHRSDPNTLNTPYRGAVASHILQTSSSACCGRLKDNERPKAEFLDECRSLEGRVHS
jgi:hypothetical protein